MTCTLGPTYAPASLRSLETYYSARGGELLGIIGGLTHRAGYHLGRGRIYAHPHDAGLSAGVNPDGSCAEGQGGADYSVGNFPRDARGLTNAAMAIDLGPVNGKAGSEVALARWLIEECQSGAYGTADIRAINYEMTRWDRINGQASAPFQHSVNETGHVHIEWFRDSENRDKIAAISRYFEGGDMVVVSSGTPRFLDIPAGAGVWSLDGKTRYKTLTVSIDNRPSPWGTAINGVSYRVIAITVDNTIQLALIRADECSQKLVLSFADGVAKAKAEAIAAISNIKVS